MNSLAIILTCVCIHLLLIEVELLFGLTKIVNILKENSGAKTKMVEPQESEDKE